MLTHDHAPRDHSPGNSYACADISAFPAGSLVADPSTPSRRPGALVTSRQDLLITVRAVITTVRLRLGPRRRDRGARPPITVVFRLPQAPRHLRRKGLAIKLQGFGAVRALKPDKTRIWRSLKFWPCGRSTVRHRERHSGHPWRWIECSAGIGPHGAVAVIKVAQRVLRSLSPFRWHWD